MSEPSTPPARDSHFHHSQRSLNSSVFRFSVFRQQSEEYKLVYSNFFIPEFAKINALKMISTIFLERWYMDLSLCIFCPLLRCPLRPLSNLLPYGLFLDFSSICFPARFVKQSGLIPVLACFLYQFAKYISFLL